MVARGAGAAGPVLRVCRQWDPLGLARRLPSLGVGVWRSAPLLPWQVQCSVRVCAALAAGSGGSGRYLVLCLSCFPLPAPRVPRCVWRAVLSGCPLPSLAGTPFHEVCAWEETGAFRKLQLQNLDALLRMAANWRSVDGQPGIYTVGHPEEEEGVSQEEAVWFCQDRFDQFYRRQVIYPVTEHGLGEPYGAADGLLEGDSAAPAVYQTASAVRNRCSLVSEAVHFSKGDKVLGVSELILSDDRRLFDFRKEYFEDLTWDRIETTKSAGGIVNPGKLELFHAVLRQGVLQLDEEEACVGLMMRASKPPPKCISVPVSQETKPLQWLSATAAQWRKLTPNIVIADFLPIKTVRVIMAFMVAQFDYAASAYLFREE